MTWGPAPPVTTCGRCSTPPSPKRGYFPNPQLAGAYPRWRPIVSTPPARLDVYDDRTRRRWGPFQVSRQLPSTGIVDQPTRRLLLLPDCGFPDGVRRPDPREKFLLEGSAWKPDIADLVLHRRRRGWDLQGPDPRSDQTLLRHLAGGDQPDVHGGFRQRGVQRRHLLRRLRIKSESGTGGIPRLPGNHTIVFNPAYTWSVSNDPIPSDQADFETTMLHEIGTGSACTTRRWGRGRPR
jgi:hypothetical protein